MKIQNENEKVKELKNFLMTLGLTLNEMKERIEVLEKTIVFKEIKRGYIG